MLVDRIASYTVVHMPKSDRVTLITTSSYLQYSEDESRYLACNVEHAEGEKNSIEPSYSRLTSVAQTTSKDRTREKQNHRRSAIISLLP
jgi:hypothetical protein